MRVFFHDSDPTRAAALAQTLRAQKIKLEMPGDAAMFQGLAGLDPEAARLLPMLIGLTAQEGAARIRVLRANGCGAPLLALRETAEPDELAQLLDAGADDVITAPYPPQVIAAKLRAALRGAHDMRSDRVVVGALAVHMDGRHPEISGQEVRLSTKENEVLRFLALNRGKVLPRSAIFDALYTLSDYQPHEKSIDVHICKIRRKLSDHTADGRNYIETFSGRGYALARIGAGAEGATPPCASGTAPGAACWA
ncbi:response regulator transcription factor [Sulfitobacter aestuarii]|uniref:Response regulator transcription factor n=1 Tax=Sulfitobacter aestuarii TaxID=2161676 RepID=A0ABW5U2M5_9RHOB